MTIDEAIEHSEKTAAEQEAQAKFYKTYLSDEVAATECQDCAKEHRQLAEWLKELRQYWERNTKEDVYYGQDVAGCPTCGQLFLEGSIVWKADYCFRCGQKLKW